MKILERCSLSLIKLGFFFLLGLRCASSSVGLFEDQAVCLARGAFVGRVIDASASASTKMRRPDLQPR
jgi:hypothetical protein